MCHVATTTPMTEVAVIEPEFSDTERYGLSGCVAGYRAALAHELRSRIEGCWSPRLGTVSSTMA